MWSFIKFGRKNDKDKGPTPPPGKGSSSAARPKDRRDTTSSNSVGATISSNSFSNAGIPLPRQARFGPKPVMPRANGMPLGAGKLPLSKLSAVNSHVDIVDYLIPCLVALTFMLGVIGVKHFRSSQKTAHALQECLVHI